MQRESKLLQMIRALHAARCFTRRLNRRQEERDQYPNDGDHHQKFNKGETASACRRFFLRLPSEGRTEGNRDNGELPSVQSVSSSSNSVVPDLDCRYGRRRAASMLTTMSNVNIKLEGSGTAEAPLTVPTPGWKFDFQTA